MAILLTIFGFSFLILMHELGHLIMAKRAGVLCYEFSIGMGWKLFSLRIGETTYTIRVLPVGGYVRMAEETTEKLLFSPNKSLSYEVNEYGKITKMWESPKQASPCAIAGTIVSYDAFVLVVKEEDEIITYQVEKDAVIVVGKSELKLTPAHRKLDNVTLKQKTGIILAGPLVNIMLCFVLFGLLNIVQGVPNEKSVLGEVTPNGVAYKAGLQKGDKILSVNNKPIHKWEEFRNEISLLPNQPVLLEINRKNKNVFIHVTPREQDVDGQKVGRLDVTQAFSKNPFAAMKRSGSTTLELTQEVGEGFKKVVTEKEGTQQLSGPVGIFQFTYKFANEGLQAFVFWMAFLSLNLGLFNLIPLPVLDGGRLAIFYIEAIRKKTITPKGITILNLISFTTLLIIVLFSTWNDILRLVRG